MICSEIVFQFYQNDVAMQYFMQIFQHYTQLNLNLYNCMGDTNIDVLIKMIRVIANISVNSEVGKGLGSRLDLAGILLNLLKSNMKDIKVVSKCVFESFQKFESIFSELFCM